MNYVLSKKVSASGYDRFARGQALRKLGASYLTTLGEDLGSARPVNGAIDTAAAKQTGIGGVYNGIDLLLRDVPNYDDEAPFKKLSWFHLALHLRRRGTKCFPFPLLVAQP